MMPNLVAVMASADAIMSIVPGRPVTRVQMCQSENMHPDSFIEALLESTSLQGITFLRLSLKSPIGHTLSSSIAHLKTCRHSV